MTWFSPYDPVRKIGTVASVSPLDVVSNLSNADRAHATGYYGHRLSPGEVGDLVFIEAGELTVLARISKVWLEGGDRFVVDSLEGERTRKTHPLGSLQPLATIQVSDGKVDRGITKFPSIGAFVYGAHPLLVSHLLAAGDADDQGRLRLEIASLPDEEHVRVAVSPERIFGRHCAVLGATGGGKSYTVAKLVECIRDAGGKALLIDATGEFSALGIPSFYVGNRSDVDSNRLVSFPHTEFTDSDLRAMLRPSPQSQAPKMAAAIKSLKMVRVVGGSSTGLVITAQGNLQKSLQKKAPFEALAISQASVIEKSAWNFSALAEQIAQECVWPDGGSGQVPDTSTWGKRNEADLGHCLNLISRVKYYSESPHHRWLFDAPLSMRTVGSVMDDLASSCSGVVRLDVSAVPFEGDARELLVNAIGRRLLSMAREGKISKDSPLIVILDEAHQFLNKNLSGDSLSYPLDAFGGVAKEGRKYGLTTVIATQRVRDIPSDVFSQIGTFIVHRLSNHYDREAVERALGDLDPRSAAMLPSLSTGEALLGGVGFSFPLVVKMILPQSRPDTSGAKYSAVWRSPEVA